MCTRSGYARRGDEGGGYRLTQPHWLAGYRSGQVFRPFRARDCLGIAVGSPRRFRLPIRERNRDLYVPEGTSLAVGLLSLGLPLGDLSATASVLHKLLSGFTRPSMDQVPADYYAALVRVFHRQWQVGEPPSANLNQAGGVRSVGLPQATASTGSAIQRD